MVDRICAPVSVTSVIKLACIDFYFKIFLLLLLPAAEEKRCVGDETLNKYEIHTQ